MLEWKENNMPINIDANTITQLASEGYSTLQVPQYHVTIPNMPVVATNVKIITVPDDYFCMLKSDENICMGK